MASQEATGTMLARYRASMLLAGVGDAIAYRKGKWEFCRSGEKIHKELAEMGGLEKVQVKLPSFNVSDDTVMLLATAQALVSASRSDDKEKLFLTLAKEYKKCMHDMVDRAPGITTNHTVGLLRPDRKDGYCIPFSITSGGCGAAMRAMCIGLRYPRPEDLDDLIMVSVEAGRMSHHLPVGYLGSLATALLTSYAVQDKPLREWGAGLMSVLPKAKEYVRSVGRFVEENMVKWNYFEANWKDYLKFRKITDGQSDPQFTADDDDIKKRDALYKSWSYSGCGGSSGHDAPMIAYDALMRSGSSWKELCMRGMFHGGDSDSTGVIAGAWFGALYGMEGVPEGNYKNLEYRDRLENMGKKLFQMSGLPESSEDVNPGLCSCISVGVM